MEQKSYHTIPFRRGRNGGKEGKGESGRRKGEKEGKEGVGRRDGGRRQGTGIELTEKEKGGTNE